MTVEDPVIETWLDLRATAEGAFQLVRVAREAGKGTAEVGRCLCRFMEAGLAEVHYIEQHYDVVKAYMDQEPA